LLLLFALLGGLLWVVLHRYGMVVYALDDAYIHLAMARSLALHGTWGLVPGEFANSSSSPLWTLLLAALVRLFGTSPAIPLALNWICAALLLLVVHFALREVSHSRAWRFLVLALVIFWTPLPSLVFTGQEHVLQSLLTLVCLLRLPSAGARVESHPVPAPGPTGRAGPATGDATLCGFAFLLVGTRFEGLFVVLLLSLTLGWRGRLKSAFLVALAGAAPVLILGVVSAAHGWYWLPNPILLKGNLLKGGSIAALADFARHAYRQALANPHMLLLIAASLALLSAAGASARPSEHAPLRRPRRSGAEPASGGRYLQASAAGGPGRDHVIALAAWVALCALHLQFARLKWFYRYEAYLVAAGVVLAARLLLAASPWGRAKELTGRIAAAAGLALALWAAAALTDRGAEALARVPKACGNIFEQQIQVAEFLDAHFEGQTVAVNDVGAVAFFGNVRVLDLWGLASLDVARARLHGIFDRNAIESLAREEGCALAVVYDAWYEPGAFGGIPPGRPGGLPASWQRVQQWRIRDNVVAGEDAVSFYALDSRGVQPLAEALTRYAPSLPPRVTALPLEIPAPGTLEPLHFPPPGIATPEGGR